MRINTKEAKNQLVNMNEYPVKVSFWVSEKLRTKFRLLTIEQKTTMQAILENFVKEFVAKRVKNERP